MLTRVARALGLTLGLGALVAVPAQADPGQGTPLARGNLLVSNSIYEPGNIVPGVTELPPGCTGSGCMLAVAPNTFPFVFNNDIADPNFGITSKAFLDELTPSGQLVGDHPGPGQPVRHELLVEVGVGAQSQPRGQVRVVHGLCRHTGDDRRLEREHAGRDRPG